MQLQFRIDDNNYVVFQLELSAASPESGTDGPEVIATVVTESKLSDLSADELYDLAGQVCDQVGRAVPQPAQVADWRDEFRKFSR